MLPKRFGFTNIVYKFFLVLFILATLVFPISTRAASNNRKIYLPIIIKSGNSTPTTPIMLGIYPPDWWNPHPAGVISNLFQPMDTWAGKKLSIAAIFHSIEQYGTVISMLPPIWDGGYTPFVNLSTTATLAQIASGGRDYELHQWAKNYKTFTNNGQRMAYMAPLQEANYVYWGNGPDPSNFIAAFKRIESIFAQDGVPRSSVKWVFAPNGYSRPGTPGFESYYPGDSSVDVIAFSGYNFGYYPTVNPKNWSTYQSVFTPYLDRMRAMAPSKPIFIAQTGTSAYYSANGVNNAAKDQWLRDTYNYLASYKGVRAIIYYNADIDFDWQIYAPGGDAFTGYKDGVANPAYGYISPSTLKNLDLTVH